MRTQSLRLSFRSHVRLGNLRFRNQGNPGVIGAAFAPDGKTIATVGVKNAPLCLWDPATGKLLHALRPADLCTGVLAMRLVYSSAASLIAGKN